GERAAQGVTEGSLEVAPVEEQRQRQLRLRRVGWEEDQHVVDRVLVLERVERELERLAAKRRTACRSRLPVADAAALPVAAEDEDDAPVLVVELEVGEGLRRRFRRHPDRAHVAASGAADP